MQIFIKLNFTNLLNNKKILVMVPPHGFEPGPIDYKSIAKV